ncbi:UDP-N-acetylmuramoyl-L-alanine--D-glutamate ligase [Pelomonas sp. V22]|nr:UDP-N-acetylmuramoyl-L-alanine--D-glutamate ligase [Pelomonas sp. V22]MDI4635287.1 UDP-N-acetylmuramoyl-L-alanine--D-glutamate ligase [Pelomonas sp. V22]
MAAWAARQGAAAIRVWDSRETPPQLAALKEQVPAAQFFSGALQAADAEGLRSVLKSPGLSPLDARLQPLLSRCRELGLPLLGELDLFAQALNALKAERRYAPIVLAITGTNGKTTTTSLTGQMVERCGKRVAVAGNIGPSMLTTLAAALDQEPVPAPAEEAPVAEVIEAPADVSAEPAESAEAEATDAAESAEAAPAESELTTLQEVEALLDEAPLPIKPPPPKGPVFEHLPEAWVLELSSFQLEGVEGFEPTAATVLNITQDHLDWHGDMAAYARAKGRVFGAEAIMVINRDDAAVEALVPATVMVSPGRGRRKIEQGRNVVRFGLDAPKRPGDYGLVNDGGMAWLVRALESDPTIKRKAGDEEEELVVQRLMPADALRIRGRHNAANALAALALCTAAGLPLAPMLHGLREYRGEPHRVQHIGTLDGVDFYDDSKGTNVGATVAALSGLGADRAPAKLVVILGGDGKGQDFSPLRAPLIQNARAVALIGRDAAAIESVLLDSGLVMQRHDTLEAATAWCFAQAHSGDSVLLSPACASLDMFRNYAHRAEVFVAAAEALAADKGASL